MNASDLRPRLPALLLMALAGAFVAGCATPVTDARSGATAGAPMGATVATPASGSTAVTPAVSGNTDPSVASDNRDAIGELIDPMNPDRPVNLQPPAQHDLWARIRKGFGMPDLSNDLVAQRQQWYAGQPDYIERMSTRGGRYLFHIVEELERRNMPSELALLPFVESAFNPVAISSAKAQGLWQFMPATGRTFQLKQNLFRDERRDVLESTRAALDYLQRLHGMFNDWHLALAAYNWGEGNVQRAIRRNEAAGLPTQYDSLNMPAETRHYVPKLQALKNIIAQPEAFQVKLIDLPNHPYFLSVPIQRDIDVALAARLAGLSIDEFRNLNPSQKKPVILASGTPQVLLPFDNAESFQANLAKHRGPLASYTAWIVPKTMKTKDAASQVGMDESDLRQLNSIPPKMLVKAGSTLLVERNARLSHDVSEAVADNASLGLAPDLPPVQRIALRAGRSDTVASVAKRYRLNPGLVAQWNRVGPRAGFKRGQAIVLWVPRGATVASAPRAAPAVIARAAPAQFERKVIVDKRGRKQVVKVAVVDKVKSVDKTGRAIAASKRPEATKVAQNASVKSKAPAPDKDKKARKVADGTRAKRG